MPPFGASLDERFDLFHLLVLFSDLVLHPCEVVSCGHLLSVDIKACITEECYVALVVDLSLRLRCLLFRLLTATPCLSLTIVNKSADFQKERIQQRIEPQSTKRKTV